MRTPSPDTVPDLLRGLLRGDATRPVVTWVEPASGVRTELSLATLANWVAKTGGLLQDELEVAAGDRVRLSLPSHWLAVTWALGCWAVGAVVEPADTTAVGEPPAVEVFGDDRTPRTDGRLVVVGLGPFGGAARPGPSLVGALDAGTEVLGHPDHLVAYDPPEASSPALVSDTGVLDQRSLLALARATADRVGLGPGQRLLTDAVPLTPGGLVEVVLVPLVAAGSVVLLSGPHDASTVADLAARERADAVRVSGC